jgi:hypothetical protein
MSVRIETASEDSQTIVRVAGRLAGPGVHELMRTCRSAGGQCVLDLTGLRSADPDGIEAIRTLVRGVWKLRGVSPFIQLLLNDQPAAEAE